MATVDVLPRRGHKAVGYVEGTGAAINLSLGFVPKIVRLFNTEGNCQMTWINGMGAGYGQKIVDSGSGTTDISFVSTGGITVTADGFSIGTDSDLNVNGEDLFFVAEG